MHIDKWGTEEKLRISCMHYEGPTFTGITDKLHINSAIIMRGSCMTRLLYGGWKDGPIYCHILKQSITKGGCPWCWRNVILPSALTVKVWMFICTSSVVLMFIPDPSVNTSHLKTTTFPMYIQVWPIFLPGTCTEWHCLHSDSSSPVSLRTWLQPSWMGQLMTLFITFVENRCK